MDYNSLTTKDLRVLAKDRSIRNWSTLKKVDLVAALNRADANPDVEDIQQELPPDTHNKDFKFLPGENRWVLTEIDLPQYRRTYDQKAVLHTSEEAPSLLTRAYNMESLISINDEQLELGAEARGQKLGDASAGSVAKDSPPESGE